MPCNRRIGSNWRVSCHNYGLIINLGVYSLYIRYVSYDSMLSLLLQHVNCVCNVLSCWSPVNRTDNERFIVSWYGSFDFRAFHAIICWSLQQYCIGLKCLMDCAWKILLFCLEKFDHMSKLVKKHYPANLIWIIVYRPTWQKIVFFAGFIKMSQSF